MEFLILFVFVVAGVAGWLIAGSSPPLGAIILCAVLLLLLTAGCASVPETPTAPDVVRVTVPIRAEPKQRTLPEKPRFLVDDLPLGSTLADQARMCFAERDQRRAYEIELEGACR